MKDLFDKLFLKKQEVLQVYKEVELEFLKQLSNILKDFPEINHLVFHVLHIHKNRKNLVLKKINNHSIFITFKNMNQEHAELISILVAENIQEHRLLLLLSKIENHFHSIYDSRIQNDTLMNQILSGKFYTEKDGESLVVKKATERTL